MSTLQSFKSTLKQGGARPNLFQVNIPNLAGQTEEKQGNEAQDFTFLVKGASLPESTIGLVEIPFRGRTFKVAGDRTFAPWSITVINDTEFKIRTAMEEWAQSIAQYGDGGGNQGPEDYMREATVTQLGRNGIDSEKAIGNELKKLKTYKFYDIWPSSISAIDLSYDSSDVIEEFTVEFQVQYWAPEGLKNGKD